MNKMILCFFILGGAPSILVSNLASADSLAVSTLKNAIGNGVMECHIKEAGKYQPAPPNLELKVIHSRESGNEVIFVTAHYDNAVYSVDEDSIQDGNLIIAMNNNIDGPHSEDKLEIPLSALDQMTSNANIEIDGSDHYSEDEDGTSSVFNMTCKRSPF